MKSLQLFSFRSKIILIDNRYSDGCNFTIENSDCNVNVFFDKNLTIENISFDKEKSSKNVSIPYWVENIPYQLKI